MAGLFVIESGTVKISRFSKDGCEHILMFLRQDATFNDVAVLDGEPNPVTAIAHTESTVVSIAHADLQAVAWIYPELGWALAQSIARRARFLVNQVQDLSMRNVRGRLAGLLLEEAAPPVGPPPRAMGVLSTLLPAGAVLLTWSQRPTLADEALPAAPRFTGLTGNTADLRDCGARQDTSEGALRLSNHTSAPTLEAADAVLRVTQLCKRYPQPGRAWWSDATITAVDQLSFSLARGEALALWGVNGAGKTTVLKCLLGLLDCEGDLWLDGADLRKDGRKARRSLGYVPQELPFTTTSPWLKAAVSTAA